jgi:rod shape-determining protein MreB and related proteins
MEETNDTLCVGIDLGTSRSSISASNGERHVIDSYVGWPLDMVARKLSKKSVLIGREALDNRSMLDLRRFCVMQGHYPTEEDQRTLPNAGDFVDEQLIKLIREHHPDAQFSIHMIREWKEKYSFVGQTKTRVTVTVPTKGRATELDITEDMRAACESILPPICETLLDLLSKVEPEYQDKVRNNIILAGGTSLIAGLPEAIQNALHEMGGGRATVVRDPVFAGSDGGLAIAKDASNADWEKLSL